MTLGMLSSALFGDMFGTAAMRAVFGEPAFLARCAEVEAALARAQARLGIVPAEAARRSPRRPPRSPPIRNRSTWRGCGARPRMSATRSCRWCGSSPSAPARPGAGCIGARRRRTSWTPPSCCRSARGSQLIEARPRGDCAAISPRWRDATATRRWPGAPTCSTRCRSPSATRRRCGSPASTAMRRGSPSCKPRVLVGAVRRRRRNAGLARRRRGGLGSRTELARELGSPSRRSPGTSRATRSPRRCSSWRCSAAASARSRST